MFPLQPLAASMEHGAWLGPGRLGSPDGFEVNSCLQRLWEFGGWDFRVVFLSFSDLCGLPS